jgi:hypothetical protein
MSFIDNIQINPSPLLVEFIIRREGDLMDVNIKHHLPMDGIHP